MITIGFGGGCHWCTEAVFQSLKGVLDVRQGFIRSDPPDHAFSEAVEVDFDPAVITLESLISAHLATHASTSEHKLRSKYRSAVYVFGEDQKSEAEGVIRKLQSQTGATYVTRILPARGFKPTEDRYQNYYARNPERPFCQIYIEPKFAKLRENHRDLVKEEPPS